MIKTINTRIDELKAVCVEMTGYMQNADTVFREILKKEPELETAWERFYQNKGQKQDVAVTPYLFL